MTACHGAARPCDWPPRPRALPVIFLAASRKTARFFEFAILRCNARFLLAEPLFCGEFRRQEFELDCIIIDMNIK